MKTSSILDLLLVEDNEGDVEMTERALSDATPVCHVSVANDGAQALEILRKRGDYADAPTPKLILLDLNMPGMDGKQFLEIMKADAKLKAIPVVMLTSSESPNDIRECYERYASCYVVKPFDGQQFADTVRHVVRFWHTHGRLP